MREWNFFFLKLRMKFKRGEGYDELFHPKFIHLVFTQGAENKNNFDDWGWGGVGIISWFVMSSIILNLKASSDSIRVCVCHHSRSLTIIAQTHFTKSKTTRAFFFLQLNSVTHDLSRTPISLIWSHEIAFPLFLRNCSEPSSSFVSIPIMQHDLNWALILQPCGIIHSGNPEIVSPWINSGQSHLHIRFNS